MVNFEPKFTEVIYFDTECYVPLEDRDKSQGSLIINPGNPNHFLLGGVFRREFPLQQRLDEPEHVWNWKKDGERDTLSRIYEYFKTSWKMLEGESSENPDLIVVGIGVSRFDIPMIFVRSLLNNIDSPDRLFETYFKTKIVDLSDVGIPFFTRNPYPVLYPSNTNGLASRLLQIGEYKPSGKRVWDMYDSHEYESIQKRTADEVEVIRKIASRILQLLKSQKIIIQR